jgi:hypothetical protein
MRFVLFRGAWLLGLISVAWPGVAAAQEVRKSYPRDLITREEIRERAVEAKTAYDVIRRLRPQFLRERSSGSIPDLTDSTSNVAATRHPIQVYVNGVRTASSIAELRDIVSETIIDIRYLNASDATTRFGTGHNNGAILVRTG